MMSSCEHRVDPLRIRKGDTWKYQWPLLDADGEPFPTVGWTAKGQVRRWPDSEEVLHEWSTDAGNIIISESTIMLVVEPSTSDAWEWDEGVYDVEMTSPEGAIVGILEGPVVVVQAVTR